MQTFSFSQGSNDTEPQHTVLQDLKAHFLTSFNCVSNDEHGSHNNDGLRELRIVLTSVNLETPAERYNAIKSTKEYQDHALIYIVVVLLFYSVTIVALMIKYMRQECRQFNEDKMYQDFLAKTKRLSMQQAKQDFARRVSLQLVNMAVMGHTFSDIRQQTIEELSPMEEEPSDSSSFLPTQRRKRSQSASQVLHGPKFVRTRLNLKQSPIIKRVNEVDSATAESSCCSYTDLSPKEPMIARSLRLKQKHQGTHHSVVQISKLTSKITAL